LAGRRGEFLVAAEGESGHGVASANRIPVSITALSAVVASVFYGLYIGDPTDRFIFMPPFIAGTFYTALCLLPLAFGEPEEWTAACVTAGVVAALASWGGPMVFIVGFAYPLVPLALLAAAWHGTIARVVAPLLAGVSLAVAIVATLQVAF
jgi:hypothetical protein